jgi:hypothetical protein
LDLLAEFEKRGKIMLFGKTVITFAYELGLRRFLYENSSTENSRPGDDFPWQFAKFRFAKFGQEDRVFSILSLDVGSN